MAAFFRIKNYVINLEALAYVQIEDDYIAFGFTFHSETMEGQNYIRLGNVFIPGNSPKSRNLRRNYPNSTGSSSSRPSKPDEGRPVLLMIKSLSNLFDGFVKNQNSGDKPFEAKRRVSP